jgi:hypothetical protein
MVHQPCFTLERRRRVGVQRLVPVQQDVTAQVQELQRVERDAGNVRLGGERLGRGRVAVYRRDQSERTMTTGPSGIRP